MLVDELITAEFKYAVNPTEELGLKISLLFDEINKVVKGNDSIVRLTDELQTWSKKCWDAQEVVMNSSKNDEVAMAARIAQRSNAKRNKLIRQIDELLGETNTVLEKTYE